MQTIALETISKKLRDALVGDTAIATFCQAKYKKAPSFFVGFDAKSPPKDTQCPAIIILPGMKIEGDEIDEFQYMLTVSWSILNGAVTTTNGVVEFTGLYESDQLGQLILACLAEASTNSPITSAEYSIDATMSHPQFPGRLDITFTNSVCIGGDLTF